MKRATWIALGLAVSFTSRVGNDAPHHDRPSTLRGLTGIPLTFTENQGQWDEQVRFRAHDGTATLWFTRDGVVHQFVRRSGSPSPQPSPDGRGRDIRFEQTLFAERFVGSNPNPKTNGQAELDYKSNYFLGNDASKWRANVPNYSAIVYVDIYPGIDLRYHANGGVMEHDFVIAPGADPSRIVVEYDGARSMRVTTSGDLVIETDWGPVTASIPRVFQPEQEDKTLSGRYVQLDEHQVGIVVDGGYNPELALVIDPVLTFSTYLGGSEQDQGFRTAVGNDGATYVTGSTISGDFPDTNAYDDTFNGAPANPDVFVSKFSDEGALVYSTFLGGNLTDYGLGIAVDGAGAAFVTGNAYSTDFPLLNPADPNLTGTDGDAFVAKLSPQGNALIYSTYLGGGAGEDNEAVAVDASGNAVVAGRTESPDFPLQNPIDGSLGGAKDVFVARLSPTGSSLLFSTYLGGSDDDESNDLALDTDGGIYIAGQTKSADFPLVNACDGTLGGGADAFVARISSSGGAVEYSTYLGGSSDEIAYGIDVDPSKNAYVTGITGSADFPTLNAFDPTHNGGGEDGFITKLGPAGCPIVYSTFLGGRGVDQPLGIAVDPSGAAYVTGVSDSISSVAPDSFPIVNPIPPSETMFRQYSGGAYDVFVSKLMPAGDRLSYSIYLGTSGHDAGLDIDVDNSGRASVTGFLDSSGFHTVNAYDSTHNGNRDAFVARLECHCVCTADPFCDGVISDVRDVVSTVNVAFRGYPTLVESGCPAEQTDFDCSGATDVLDAVLCVAVAFRNADPATTYCHPCP